MVVLEKGSVARADARASKPFVFEILAPQDRQKAFFVGAVSEEECQQWMAIITSNIASHGTSLCVLPLSFVLLSVLYSGYSTYFFEGFLDAMLIVFTRAISVIYSTLNVCTCESILIGLSSLFAKIFLRFFTPAL